MSHVHVLHENSEWAEPFLRALRTQDVPCRDWDLSEGLFDLSQTPPEGVFYSRMSASAHTRGHRYSPEYATALIHWLEAHDRRVINGSRAIQLEVSKAAQYAALNAAGIRTPRTLTALGRDAAIRAASHFEGPFISKHNRAGKGLGVRLFEDATALTEWLDGPDYEAPVDGILLLQQYIEAPEPFITRVEFVGGELLYAVRVDTTSGFQLCPAEACALPGGSDEMFTIIDGFASPLVARYRQFLRANRIQVAGIEFIVDSDGRAYTYDINTNTNYNPEAEARAGVSGAATLARYLGSELSRSRYNGDSIVAAA